MSKIEDFKSLNFFEKFEKNFEAFKKRSGRKIDLPSFLVDKEPARWVVEGFTWAETGEGEKYWRDIHEKWERYVRRDDTRAIAEFKKKDDDYIVIEPEAERPTAKGFCISVKRSKRPVLDFKI